MTKAMMRLAELSEMTDGWSDGEGRAPTRSAVTAATELLELIPELANISSIHPKIDGGVLFEPRHNAPFDVSSTPEGKIVVEIDEDLRPHGFPASREFRGPSEEAAGIVRAAIDLGITSRLTVEDRMTPGPARAARLDSALREIVGRHPEVLEDLPRQLRADIALEIPDVALADPGQASPVAITPGDVILEGDEPILMHARLDTRHGYTMRLDESRSGARFVTAIPSTQCRRALKAGDVDLRTAMLDPETRIFLSLEPDYGIPYKGEMIEDLLPSAGAYVMEDDDMRAVP